MLSPIAYTGQGANVAGSRHKIKQHTWDLFYAEFAIGDTFATHAARIGDHDFEARLFGFAHVTGDRPHETALSAVERLGNRGKGSAVVNREPELLRDDRLRG